MKYTYLLALVGVAVAASTGFSQTTSLPITNFTFNSPAVSGANSYSGGPGFLNGTAPTGWTDVTTGNPITDVNNYSNHPTAVSGQDATQEFEIQMNGGIPATGSVTLSQALSSSFVAGDTYSLTADAGTIGSAAALVGGSFYIADSAGTIASTTITGITPGAYSQFTVPLDDTLGTFTGPITVGFTVPSQSPNGNAFLEIDNFVLTQTAVPEPSSIAIAALGGFGLLGLVRRRRA